MDFDAPIPGQSLTSPPKQHPYERPPEISDPKEALGKHLANLSKPGKVESITNALRMDIDIKTLTNFILRSAVANGVHSIDVSMVIAPAIHQFIKKTADDVGVEYNEGLVDKEEKIKNRKLIEKEIAYKEAQKYKPKVAKEPKAPVELSDGFMERRS